MQFFMPMIPPTVTDQMHRVTVKKGKPLFYDSDELADAKAKLVAHLSKHKPEKPFEVGVKLTALWMFPHGGKHKDGEYRITKPDTDNLQKALKDCMTKVGFWKDDALVANEHIEKIWDDEMPGIFIVIEELSERNVVYGES